MAHKVKEEEYQEVKKKRKREREKKTNNLWHKISSFFTTQLFVIWKKWQPYGHYFRLWLVISFAVTIERIHWIHERGAEVESGDLMGEKDQGMLTRSRGFESQHRMS